MKINVRLKLRDDFNVDDFIYEMRFICEMKLVDVRQLPRKKKKAARKRKQQENES